MYVHNQYQTQMAKYKFIQYIMKSSQHFFLFFIAVQVQLSPFSCQHLTPPHPHVPFSILPPFGFVHGSFIHVPWWPFPFFPPPLLLLSVCSSFQCLWLYFACSFVLLIRFHLQVRSYVICLSKGNPSTLLVEMQTGAATVENSMKFPQKTKWNCLLTQQFHCWHNALRSLKHQSKRIYASQCS